MGGDGKLVLADATKEVATKKMYEDFAMLAKWPKESTAETANEYD